MSDISYTKVTPAIYEGKASNVYAVEEDSDVLVLERKDDITAGNGKKHDVIPGKGAICNQISNILCTQIDSESDYALTHLYGSCDDDDRFGAISECETVVQKHDPIKLEVVVRNIATGSIIKRLPFDDGQVLENPIIELYYKDDALNDPFINTSEAIALGAIDEDEYEVIERCALEANKILQDLFLDCGITLVDMKLEFGWDNENNIDIIDEISPDTCRLWDTETGKKLDKDIYREGGSLEDVLAAYQEVLCRLKKAIGDDEDDSDDTDDNADNADGEDNQGEEGNGDTDTGYQE